MQGKTSVLDIILKKKNIYFKVLGLNIVKIATLCLD